MRINIRRSWQLLFIVAILVFVIGVATDVADVMRYQHRMEQLMAQGDDEGALKVGERSDKTSIALTRLRMEALAHTRQMGDRLFFYPIVGQGTPYKSKGGDYELCGYLIDRQLDQFAMALPRYYTIDDHLPRHYREALTLYVHSRSNPVITYHDNIMETDYRDLQELESRYPAPRARQLAVKSHYGSTYWYYFDYLNHK